MNNLEPAKYILHLQQSAAKQADMIQRLLKRVDSLEKNVFQLIDVVAKQSHINVAYNNRLNTLDEVTQKQEELPTVKIQLY